jgi:predicted ribosomally synthesized peptide with nif11-like leader
VPQSELLRFLAQVKADPALRQMMADALTADEVSLLAQERGFLVSGSDIFRFYGQPGASSPRVGSRWPPVGGALA